MTTRDVGDRGLWSLGISVCCAFGVLPLSNPYRPVLGYIGVVPESGESLGGGGRGGCSTKRKWKKLFQAYGRGRGEKKHIRKMKAADD